MPRLPKNYQSSDYAKQAAEFERQHGDIATNPGEQLPKTKRTASGLTLYLTFGRKGQPVYVSIPGRAQ